jgi:CBS domain-containing protein
VQAGYDDDSKSSEISSSSYAQGSGPDLGDHEAILWHLVTVWRPPGFAQIPSQDWSILVMLFRSGAGSVLRRKGFNLASSTKARAEMNVRKILEHKGNKVVTLPPDTPVGIVAHRLRLERIGAIVITDEARNVMGIVSERDVVAGLAEHGARVVDMPVSALMTHGVKSCRPDDDIRAVMRLMTLHRFRHVPVIESGELLGIVSIGDVVKNRLEDMELEANVLHDYFVAHQ